MVKIDKDLLRKRAEHNDGELSSLEEITLHQFDIEKIENLDVYCRHLRILLLQNNQITKIENLHKLKELKYLNLALNNIQRIENLQKCESLQKLDLTVNFIENVLDVETLRENEFLRELFLVGNPCYNVPGYRQFVIATLPQLKFLDGIEIQKSERIEAAQQVEAIRQGLIKEWQDKQIVPPEYPPEETLENEMTEEELEKKRQEFQTKLVGHTPQARLQAARDLAKFKKPEQSTQTPQPKLPPEPTFTADGRILQRNQGKWPFHLSSTHETIVLQVEISKFLDSSLIDVDVHPHYIRIVIKNKVLQLQLDEEVSTSDVVSERSKLTGHLVVTMLKVASKGLNIEDVVASRKKKNSEPQIHVKSTRAPAHRNRRYERLFEPNEVVDIKNIVTDSNPLEPVPTPLLLGKEAKIRDEKFLKTDFKVDVDFVDDPDVPPLC